MPMTKIVGGNVVNGVIHSIAVVSVLIDKTSAVKIKCADGVINSNSKMTGKMCKAANIAVAIAKNDSDNWFWVSGTIKADEKSLKYRVGTDITHVEKHIDTSGNQCFYRS